ncbi:hypothetical protein [Hephaestia mangrovi]|uniref:hypothetical protein n=1 Tax=Hephaestia mangrovi TaxID=2873268 RepID=UPI001CA78ED1|nr:hypothetical protein [Hephaestia mangrovi]MBY8829174.1 hypothetical protein [Hephaestia mangrovi]
MTTADTILFEQFADALNRELAASGATLRVARRAARSRDWMILQDADGHDLGPIPDHADAATITAFEAMILSRKRAQ